MGLGKTPHFFTHAVPSAWNTTSLSQKGSLPYHIPAALPLTPSGSLCATSELILLEQLAQYMTIICLPLCFPKQTVRFWKANTESLISVSFVFGISLE